MEIRNLLHLEGAALRQRAFAFAALHDVRMLPVDRLDLFNRGIVAGKHDVVRFYFCFAVRIGFAA